MLDTYYIKPDSVDQIRALWISSEIERYVDWLSEQGYRPSSVRHRIQVFAAFGEFARTQGASAVQDLPEYVDAFVIHRVERHRPSRQDGLSA